MNDASGWRPSHDDPLFILAMDHRESFGTRLFEVGDDGPTDSQRARMRSAKSVIFDGLELAHPVLEGGRAGVLVDEQYGMTVIERAKDAALVLAIPIETSEREWFSLQWGETWLEHVDELRPQYAKVLVRDNPELSGAERSAQLARLAEVTANLSKIDVPLLYELIVPPTADQLAEVGGDTVRYDREVRPGLVVDVIADNQAAGVAPVLWKVEGLETPEAAQRVAEQARSGGRTADLIVLGRDAPAPRLEHWLAVAAGVEAFVGFAIGRSIWEQPIREWTQSELSDRQAARRIAERYLDFAHSWKARP